jgi:hypothetical protein
MKSDVGEGAKKLVGQDRIEFTLYTYKDKLQNTIPEETSTNTTSTNTTTPTETPQPEQILFPDLIKRKKESEQYSPTKINLGRGYGEVDRVFLPIQDKIQDQNSVEWNPGELNDLQRRLANLSYSGMDGSITPDRTVEAGKEFLGTPGLGNYGRMYLLSQALSSQDLFTRATGNILNPNMELLFSKPTLRPFTFNFRLSPRNEDEAKEVKTIIRFFKKGMAPRIENESVLFISSPLIFGIKYLMGSGMQHPGLNLIKKCSLTDCVVDYTPNNSYMTYKDGTMTSYNINLTFRELIPIYDTDYDEDIDFDTQNKESDKKLNHPIGY